jgi:ABC-type uncharacterized transport system permease subunit
VKLWFFLGLLQVFMGAIALITASVLRHRGEPSRTPVIYGCAALLVGAALLAVR